MAGLLDFTEDPRSMGLLSLGLGMLNSKGGNVLTALGQAGPGALDAMRQVKQDQQRKQQFEQQQQMQAMQMQQAQMQLAEAQRQQQDRQRRGSYLDSINPAAGPALPFTPQGALAAGLKADEVELLGPKANKPLIVGDTVLDPQTMRPLWSAPQKPEKDPEAIRALKLIHGEGTPAYVSALADYGRKMTTHAPASSLNVNTDSLGLKPKDRFEMEQKLSADYSGSTKLDRAIIGTAEDITGILKQGGALKDQAAIYKFAKALDPDGAVREADYAAIVQTAGGVDYLKALVNKALTGEQLLPKQREEMTRVVNAMAEVAKRRIGQAQRKTGANAKLYNLNPDNIFSGADDAGWAIVPGGK